MSTNNLALARVLAAMAWSGGSLRERDKESLLSLFAELGLTAEERDQVNPLLENPVTIEQFGNLARAYREQSGSAEERRGRLRRAEALLAAKTGHSPEDERVFGLLRLWVEDERTADAAGGPATRGSGEAVTPGRLHGLLGEVRRKAETLGHGVLHGPVALSLGEALRLRGSPRPLGGLLSPARQNFVTLYGALLYRVIRADNVIRPEETERLRHLLQDGFGFTGADTEAVVALIEAEVAGDADRQHLCAEFNRITEMDQRLGLVEALFAVALADGELSTEEETEIRLIANFLWIETQEYVRIRRQALGARDAQIGRS